VKGFTVDGHDFAEQAVERGAVAIVAERPLSVNVPVVVVPDSRRAMAILADAFYGQPTHRLHLIGVTGTNGKTTTTHIIEQVARKAGKKTGTHRHGWDENRRPFLPGSEYDTGVTCLAAYV
jgi:UDP-N-acetylmuramoyl-L-alanyl-D-glutamate--2,6-diaminopimelate ligase